MFETEQSLHQKGYEIIAGIDEAGRGPLAGAVVVACVIMSKNSNILGINDSKKLTAKKREMLYDMIIKEALDVNIQIISPEIIDEINILQATILGARQAVANIKIQPQIVVSDYIATKSPLYNPHLNLVGGDSKSYNVACASIVAKVKRDRLMMELGAKHPEYGFEKHKGYGTKAHYQAISKHGITPSHRKSFLKKIL